jgi:hypothetical protein
MDSGLDPSGGVGSQRTPSAKQEFRRVSSVSAIFNPRPSRPVGRQSRYDGVEAKDLLVLPHDQVATRYCNRFSPESCHLSGGLGFDSYSDVLELERATMTDKSGPDRTFSRKILIPDLLGLKDPRKQ